MRHFRTFTNSAMRRGLPLGLLLLSIALCIAGSPARAQSLDALRASGQVAERYDGLIAARSNDPAVRVSVEQINAERRKIYTKRATEQGVPVDQVGRVYAQEIFRGAPTGTYFVQENGETVRK